MQRYRSWTLTDLASDLSLDAFTLGSDTFHHQSALGEVAKAHPPRRPPG